jgi:mannose-6-phosphate isomerase-like protein (cupin superfamily)
MTTSSDACILHNRHTGERLELRRVATNGQIWLSLKGSLPPHRQGPPLHVHHEEDEEGRVIAGTLSASLDGQRIQVPAGGSARFPKGSAHRWWNDADETLVFEGSVKPVADLDLYLQAVFEILNSGSATRPPLFYMAHVAWRHRKTQGILLGPQWLQAILVPVVVMAGTILGRYRGTDWPGCPTRFAKAPLVPAERV